MADDFRQRDLTTWHTIRARVTRRQAQAVREYAARTGTTISQLTADACAAYLAQRRRAGDARC